MPAVEATPVSSSESGLIKMEDRKRPAGHDQNDAAPPSKRQATTINGNKPHPDADMPWKDDLEVRRYHLNASNITILFTTNLFTDCFYPTALHERRHLAPDAGVQAGKGHIGIKGQRDDKSRYVSRRSPPDNRCLVQTSKMIRSCVLDEK